MEAELSDKTFESRLTYIKERYLAYVDIKETSPFVIVALHEHLGLSNYIRIIVQTLCNNQASIVIPNLFGEAIDQTNRSQDDEAFLKRLNHQLIAQTIWDIVQEVKMSNKKIVLVGFSLGAAVGLKMLEFIDGIQFSMFFYGFPPTNDIKPERIKCRTFVYIGTKDKIKFLSDKNILKICKQKYQTNKQVQIYEKSGLGHGFLNPSTDNYDEDAFNDCCSHFRKQLSIISKKQQGKIQKQKKEKNNQNVNSEEGKGQQQDKQGKCHLI